MANTQKWLIPDMFWPADTAPGVYVSHEAICVLNASDKDCDIDIVLYYEDREPVQLPVICCPARRTRHIRMDKVLTDEGKNITQGVGYAALVSCSVPVSVQYTRVDTTQAANAMMTTMAQPM